MNVASPEPAATVACGVTTQKATSRSAPAVCLGQRLYWYGSHTGYYTQIPKALAALDPRTRTVYQRKGLLPRVVGKAFSTLYGWPPRNQSETCSEIEFLASYLWNPTRPHHILSLEEHLNILTFWNKAPLSLIGTIHLPPAVWRPRDLDRLHRLSSAIVLYRSDFAFFEPYVGKGRLRFVRHGVDTTFFKPAKDKPSGPPRLFFAGQFHRNTLMLQRVITTLLKRHPSLRFDLLVNPNARDQPGLPELAKLDAVTWHQGVSDEALRSLYQNATLLILPMSHSGANNAVVEALACGLPVVTTDVGGVRDYGGGEVFPLVANDDDAAMVALVERYLDEPPWHAQVSRACRAFAEANLPWSLVAQQHRQAYAELMG